MPRDSQGNTNPLPGTIVATGDTILPSQHNPALTDLYAMMTQSLSRDGQGGMRANLDMHGFRILNVGAATQPTDAVSLGQLQNGTPVGAVIDYAGPNAPATWMFAYGQEVSRTTYPVLFAAIGTTYGNGNGSTTFNLPDCRGRVVAGKGDMGGGHSGRLDVLAGQNTLGGTGGTDQHVLTGEQMPSHNHGGSTGSSGAHTHTQNGATSVGGGPATTYIVPLGNPGVVGNINSVGDHTHGIPAEGGNQPHINVQPTIIMNKIIKVSY